MAGIAGQISLKETIAASGWGSSGQHMKPAMAVSGMRARSAASCEVDRSMALPLADS
jgi:hypothetical protein